jgi:hypothetical protein
MSLANNTAAAVLAFGWAPEIRGILFVTIGVVALCGSVYLLLGTNLGFRLGFLVAMAGLFGWLLILGLVWLAYASTSTTLGLQGRSPTWVGKEIVVGDLTQADSEVVRGTDLESLGFVPLSPDNPGYGQASAAADEILVQESGTFTSTDQYKVVAVYDKDGGAYPAIGSFDFFAWFHRPHWAVVEVRPVVPQEAEPGRAPPTPVIDESQPPVYVVMLRDLGTQRVPAWLLTAGSGLMFALTLFLLHRREKLVNAHLSGGSELARVEAPEDKVEAEV